MTDHRAGGELREFSAEIRRWIAHTRTLAGRLRAAVPGSLAAILSASADQVEDLLGGWPEEPPGV
jgi:hypothetical protein